MAEIRAVVTVPVTAQFAGLGAPTLCAPVLYETTSGDIYVLLAPDAVVKAGGVPGSSDFVIGQQVFSRHIEQPQAILGDASEILAMRVFGTRALPAMWR